jgi:hypothetical protein
LRDYYQVALQKLLKKKNLKHYFGKIDVQKFYAHLLFFHEAARVNGMETVVERIEALLQKI